MSTDTAFALGVPTLVAPRGATRLRVFLLTLVIVDDLCGLLVIATVYSRHISVVALKPCAPPASSNGSLACLTAGLDTHGVWPGRVIPALFIIAGEET